MGLSRVFTWSCALLLSACLAPAAAFAASQPAGEPRYAAGQSDALVREPAAESPADADEPADADAPSDINMLAMFRLYNLRTGEHFYTSSTDEYDGLIEAGWFGEGIGWVAPSFSSTPVYRLYNPYAGDHHYTTDAAERDRLAASGWTDEGVGWYSDDRESVPMHRQYNPNVATGSHNFTTSEEENDGLVAAGWVGEGTAWYAVGRGLPSAMTWFSRNNMQAIADIVPGADWITQGYGTSISPEQLDVLYQWIDAEPTAAFMAINARTGKCVAYKPDRRMFSASSAKAPYIAALCKYEAPGIADYQDVLYDVITNSSNEAFAYLNTIYGKSYVMAFGREAGFDYDSPFDPAYAYYTPREIVKLWIDIHDFLVSDAPYSDMYRNLFGRGSIYKEGWMFPGTWCGQIYNLTGVTGDTMYGIMSRSANQSPSIMALRDALVSITS